MNQERFSHYNSILHGIGLIVAPIVLLVSTTFFYMGGNMDSDDIGGTMQILAFFFFIIAALGLTEILASTNPKAAIVFRVLLLFGSVYGAINGLSSVLADKANGGITSLPSGLAQILVFPGILFPLSLGVLGLVLWKKGLVNAPSGIALSLGGFLFPVGRIPDIVILYFVADILLILAMGWIGLQLLKKRGQSCSDDF
jgi:hypothetical protein